jgi:dTDP-4-dehydrorhamnose 3,5-epimerase
MRLSKTRIEGCFNVEVDKLEDSRGFFARSWCAREFGQAGLPEHIVQSSISFNRKRGTLRGMHLQRPPSAEGKLVRCIRGAIYDVVIDLRIDSASYLTHVGLNLDPDSRRALFVPPGCAHGFQTLEDETEVLYMMTDFYEPELALGVRWNDPVFGIEWPIDMPIMNERDAKYPDFDESNIRNIFR